MKYHWRYIILLFAAVSCVTANAQKVLTESEVVALAMKNSAAYQSADLQVSQSRSLQRTGINIPNPELTAESPTGEFYAVGILQSMEFPSVYFKQNKLRKQMTKLSEKQKEVTRQDVNNLVRSLYLNLQLAKALYSQLTLQDSLYNQIAKTAARQFDAGTIDHLAKTFAQSQAGEIHNQLLQNRQEYEVLLNQLKMYAGIRESFDATPLARLPNENTIVLTDSTSIMGNPSVQYYEQLKHVNRQSLSVERNKALPGIVFGYLNQGARETDTYYRFRAGVTLPLWFWQYSGSIKAARTGVKIADLDSRAQRQSVTAEMHQALGDLRKFDQSLAYYETIGLRQADDIINTSRRFFESGQNDYISYLRNINEAYLIKARYLETLKNFNQAVITVNYLTGQL